VRAGGSPRAVVHGLTAPAAIVPPPHGAYRVSRTIERNIHVIWKPTTDIQRAEALGVASAIKLLEREKSVKVLTHGRPDSGLGRNGPDIIAIDAATNRITVVEAKGSLQKAGALERSRAKSVTPSVIGL